LQPTAGKLNDQLRIALERVLAQKRHGPGATNKGRNDMATYVLGTHVSHNGSACLLKDGEVAVAIEKERLTRVKHDGANDNAAVRYCLAAAGISLRDVELVVQNSNFDMFARGPNHWVGERLVNDARKVVTISHHLAHACSAVGTSPFTDLTVLTIDGCGNSYADCIDKEGATIPEHPPNADLRDLYFEKDSYYEYRDGRLRAVFKDFSPWGSRQRYSMYPSSTMHSIGGAYLGVSTYVFRGIEDPGKLMGLAPYGRPGVYDFEMFTLKDGRAFLNYDWMKEFNSPAKDQEHFQKNFQYYADIAFWAQRQIENALLYVVNSRYDMCPSPNLGYAGGVALNAVANRLLRTKSKFENLYVQPAAADNGLAIGCAYYGWMHVLGKARVRHSGSSHFGKRYSAAEIDAALQAYRDRIKSERGTDIVGGAAQLIADGKVIGWFQGGSEFGPRALGHRSILALPVRDELKQFINSKIKFREDFRPFAPSVCAEKVAKYFDMDYASPYMLQVAATRPEWQSKIPAVVHCDGSARVQTVHRDITPRYHELHEAVEKRTGLGVLLNTSLNRRGMPIVETPKEAIALLLETALDALVIEDWLITKKQTEQASLPRIEELFGRLQMSLGADATGARPFKGVLQLRFTGLEEAWTVDFSQKAIVRRGTATPDHTVVIPYSALLEALRDPSRLQELYTQGRVLVPGLARHEYEALQVIWAKMAYLVALVRK